MQDVDTFLKLCDVDTPVGVRVKIIPQFVNSGADSPERLGALWSPAALHFKKVLTESVLDVLGKPAKTLQAVTHPDDLSVSSLSLLFLVIFHVLIMAK